MEATPAHTQRQLSEFQEIIRRMDSVLAPRAHSVRVNIGIDEDLKMILDMDPSIMDATTPAVTEPAVVVPPRPTCPPTFKTVTPTSRTQLKLQLMREKWQEEERREAEKQAQQQSSSTSIKVPVNIHSFGIDVPPQVLQVRTELENPTRYHVMQKQKNQVRQFLCESGQQPLLAAQQVLGSARGQLSAVHSAPVNSTPVIPEQQPKQNMTSVSSENILSPSLSSVATSASEAEDILEDFLPFDPNSDKIRDPALNIAPDVQLVSANSLYEEIIGLGPKGVNKTSNSCPPDLPQIKPEPIQLSDAELHALAKDRQKKDNHNMIERRRRFNINDRIKELGTLLPKTNDPYYEIVRDVRPNKGTILKSSVDYIKLLKSEVERMKQSEQKQRQLELQNRKLLLRVQELELLAKSHGLPITDTTWQPASTQSVIATYIKNNPSTEPLRKIPDVLTEAATLSASQVEDLMEDDHPVNGDPMFSSPQIPSPLDHHALDDDFDHDPSEKFVDDVDMVA
ncbi:microphthalmia-associated transcription factor isoform X1 [Schistocerca nitens]|uniref:microphthalmia-associated transcription factor isoform X1 n=1 Tax=Schistocerca nitens TaxID=7011 RepID=UPI002118D35B|nr:microphthalmia-associated transcription factor isoform X1 [Schistocerca nitens]